MKQPLFTHLYIYITFPSAYADFRGSAFDDQRLPAEGLLRVCYNTSQRITSLRIGSSSASYFFRKLTYTCICGSCGLDLSPATQGRAFEYCNTHPAHIHHNLNQGSRNVDIKTATYIPPRPLRVGISYAATCVRELAYLPISNENERARVPLDLDLLTSVLSTRLLSAGVSPTIYKAQNLAIKDRSVSSR